MNGVQENQKLEFVLSVKVPGGIEKKCPKCGGIRFNNWSYCKKCDSEYSRLWRKNNPEKAKEKDNRYHKANSEKIKEKSRLWRKANPEKCNEYSRKRKSNLKGNLSFRIGDAIRTSLHGNKNGHHWESLVGYSTDQLRERLEKQFIDGMTWDNKGEWHIDHIIPISKFNFEKPEDLDFKRCWALSNLQPLWAIDNHKKHAKIIKPFQPSLLISW